MKMTVILLITLTLGSCSLLHRVGVKASAGAVKTATVGMETEYNFSYFEKSALSNLALIEGLLYVDPQNENLLSSLIKGHAGIGYGVYETKFLDDFYKGKDDSLNKKSAIEHYTKAMHLAKRFFVSNNADFNEYLKISREDKLAQEYLSSHFNDADLTGLFFTGQSLASLINLQRENITLLSQLNSAKNLFDFVCLKDPEFSHGACDVFYGAYYLGRPKTLGGDPDKGQKILSALIKKDKNNLLSKVSYLQFYAIVYENEDEFKRMEKELNIDIIEFNKLFNYTNSLNPNQRFKDDSTLNLYNAIAIERFKIIQKNKKEMF